MMSQTLAAHTVALTLLMLASGASAQPWTGHRADGHAPIGVMADHTHGAGEVMLSYRFMYMDMEGSRDGTDPIADVDVVSPTGQDFRVTPVRMPMQMHMVGAMYAPTNSVTLMAMVPFLSNEMDHLTRPGGTFTTESGGLGDVKIGALVGLSRFGRQRLHAGLNVSIPTGSISETDTTPMGDDQQLPYPMQVGSGTFDLTPSLTFLGQTDVFGYGLQASGTIPVNKNSRDYSLGARYGATGWASVLVAEQVSLSARLDARRTEDIDGADPAYGMGVSSRLVPTVFTDLRAGTRMDLSVGLNLMAPHGVLDGLRVAAEAGVPLYQNLDGPQLETDLVVALGAQYAF